MADGNDIFDAAFLRKLEALDAALLRLRGSVGEGARGPGRAQGRSEFIGHRAYTPGDDLRRLDWNAYGRLGRLFMREFEHERAEHVTILLDCSRSMAAGVPPKHVLARRAAAAFGYLALRRGGSATLAGNTAVEGVSRFHRLLEQLTHSVPDSDVTLRSAAEALASRARPPSDLVVITDALEPLESLKPLAALSERRTAVTLLQVLAPDELDPAPGGAIELLGLEEREALKLDLDASTIAAYRAELERHIEGVEGVARRHGWIVALAESDADLQELFVGRLLKAGATP